MTNLLISIFFHMLALQARRGPTLKIVVVIRIIVKIEIRVIVT